MNAPTPEGGHHWKRARACLDDANDEMNTLPTGTVNTQELIARSAKSQVIVSAAIAHALLEIGDVLRAAFREPSDG